MRMQSLNLDILDIICQNLAAKDVVNLKLVSKQFENVNCDKYILTESEKIARYKNFETMDEKTFCQNLKTLEYCYSQSSVYRSIIDRDILAFAEFSARLNNYGSYVILSDFIKPFLDCSLDLQIKVIEKMDWILGDPQVFSNSLDAFCSNFNDKYHNYELFLENIVRGKFPTLSETCRNMIFGTIASYLHKLMIYDYNHVPSIFEKDWIDCVFENGITTSMDKKAVYVYGLKNMCESMQNRFDKLKVCY